MEIKKRIICICAFLLLSLFLGYGFVSHDSQEANSQKDFLFAKPEFTPGSFNPPSELETQESEAIGDISSLKNTDQSASYDESSPKYVPVEVDSETDPEYVSDVGKSEHVSDEYFALQGRIICIDPGHCVTPLTGKGYTGPVSPLSDEMKPLYTTGTRGKNLTEEQLNLMVGIKLRDELKSLGATVLMTREVSEITISGVERCEIANEGKADVHIHIHADGVDNPAPHGVSVLVPTGDLLGTPSIVDESVRLGQLMVDCVAETTGAKNRGIMPRSDMTGFNFSEVPTVLIEMGFMTNPEEDALLETDEYQGKIVKGMIKSLFLWYGIDDA